MSFGGWWGAWESNPVSSLSVGFTDQLAFQRSPLNCVRFVFDVAPVRTPETSKATLGFLRGGLRNPFGGGLLLAASRTHLQIGKARDGGGKGEIGVAILLLRFLTQDAPTRRDRRSHREFGLRRCSGSHHLYQGACRIRSSKSVLTASRQTLQEEKVRGPDLFSGPPKSPRDHGVTMLDAWRSWTVPLKSASLRDPPSMRCVGWKEPQAATGLVTQFASGISSRLTLSEA